uniref:Peptidase metallopeptidase domain-containing protein n=1 Tax=Ciona savignyi TaxID=51511 RepID=H2Z0T6_CIOSA
FLVKYGYLSPHQSTRTRDELTEATSTFQRMYGLAETGLLDQDTLTLMRQPRCGLWDDVDRQSIESKHLVRKKRYTLMGNWPSKKITYGFRMYTDDMSTVQQQDAVARALEVWSRDTPLVFTQVSQWQKDVNIMISFLRGYHNDGYPFDGPGHTLAHAFYPGQGDRSGDVHFDADEKWTYKAEGDGTNLFMVAVHEFGHALGLGHSTSQGSVMLPFYQGFKDGIALNQDDIQAVYTLYGEQDLNKFKIYPKLVLIALIFKHNTIQSPNPTLGSTSGVYRENRGIPSTQSPELCEKKFDAVANIRNEIYFFRDNYFWRITMNGHRYNRVKMKRFWQNFPDVTVDAAYSRGSKIYLFSGTRYWTYTDTVMDAGSPRPISDFGLPMHGGIDAAMVWYSNGGTYFFKGRKFWKYDEELRRMESGYPRDISVLRDVPTNIDAALTNPSDQSVYFLKGTRCWKLDDDLLSVSKGYPEYIGVKWFGCNSATYDGVREPQGVKP